jgi:16S rRNA (guanine527-N7)-methyltransferase
VVTNILTAEAFGDQTGVSRETLTRLKRYEALLRKWQHRMNLVGPTSLDDFWRRHMLDAAQLFPLLPAETRCLVDLGSGAGLPGLVLAIMGVPGVHLIESDRRKAVFLSEAARVTETPAIVHAARIEALPCASVCPDGADVVTARGLAPLPTLLDYAEPLLTPTGTCLFLKGHKVNEELTMARKEWTMRLDRIPSRSDPRGTILRLAGLSRGALPDNGESLETT